MIKPLEDRIVLQVEKADKEETTASGLVIPGSAREENNQALVVAVGEGRTLPSGVKVQMDVKVGDIVIYNPMAVREIEHEGTEYLIVYSADILAIVESDE